MSHTDPLHKYKRKPGYGRFIGFVALVILWLVFPCTESRAQHITIEGSVILEQAQTTAFSGENIGMYQSAASGSESEKPDMRSDDIIVWLEDTDKKNTYSDAEVDTHALDQFNKQFKPKLMAIRAGEKVRIQNSDPVYHNVFSLSKPKRFDVGRRPPDEYELVQFNKAGIIDVFCDIHSDMHAVIVVLPDHALTWQKLDGSGPFRFENIPEGKYLLHFYAQGNRRKTVEIEAQGTDEVSLESIRVGP